MKTLFLAIGITLLVFSSCTKEKGYDNQGTITKSDGRYCGCCGGWFIEIDETTYRFYDLPDDSKIILDNENLPIRVELDWEMKEKPCVGDEIIVSRIKEI